MNLGAVLVWAEATYTAGTRRCPSCGSLFADSRYTAAGVLASVHPAP